MDDIVDYSKKLSEETKKLKKTFIILCVIVAFFAFAIGFYASYVFNEGNKSSKEKDKLDAMYSILSEEWYYGKYDGNVKDTLIDTVYGMFDSGIDPFTRYLSSLGSLADSYTGLGIAVTEYKEYFMITEVSSKINANQGFQKGDILKSIDGGLMFHDLRLVKGITHTNIIFDVFQHRLQYRLRFGDF